MPARVVWHPSSLEHDPGEGHPESPARLTAILEELRSPTMDGSVEWSEANPADRTLLEAVHPPDYLGALEQFCQRGGGAIDPDTRATPVTFDAAVHAAGAAVEAARTALDGTGAFAAVRPPGHHATARTAMGFCFINNVVVAAHGAMVGRDVRRVLIVDWDVHHGNGTQDLVQMDERIRYVSMHQSPHYPGTGGADERGVGNVFNVPMPPGLSRERYRAALDDAVGRAVEGWPPDVLLVSAGFDAMAGDPLAGFTLEPDDYGQWIAGWRSLAPVAAVLEGGYDPERIRLAAAATVRALA